MNYLDYLTKIAAATEIVSVHEILFAGRTISLGRDPEKYIQKAPLKAALTSFLYQQIYCRIFNGHYESQKYQPTNRPEFSAALSAANNSSERWDEDWVIDQALPNGQFLATKNDNYKLISPGEFITKTLTSLMPAAGSGISIHIKAASQNPKEVFYFAYGNEPITDQSLFTLIRFYFNVKSTGAAKLLNLLTTSLNKFSIPFTFKCLNESSLYTRNDPAVLYIARPFYHIVSLLLQQICLQWMPAEFNKVVPAFTKRLADGVSIAEDPSTGESFGMSRCGIIADGLIQSWQLRQSSTDDKLACIQTAFDRSRVSFEAPYLNPGSEDIYQFEN